MEHTIQEIKQKFRNESDCYADTWDFDKNGTMIEGKTIQAMTVDKFIEVVKELGIKVKE